MEKIKAPSEGELFILEYLKHKNISFEREVRLNNLRFDDDFGYRAVDFYLKKYKVYIEFNGMWNNTKEDRVRYRKKKEVYRKNNIPCIYLYPENIGIIDFVFPKRLIEEMKKKSMTKELKLFQLKRFIDDRGSLFVWMIVGAILLCGDFNWQEDSGTIMFLILVCIFQVYRFIKGIYKFFIKNSPEFNMN